MGSSTSQTQTTKILTELYQNFSTKVNNTNSNEQYLDMKSKLINNYIQSLVNRNTNVNEFETNVKENVQAIVNAAASNKITADIISKDSTGDISLIQKNESLKDVANQYQSIMEHARKVLNEATVQDINEAIQQASQDSDTFNQACQSSIADIIGSAESASQVDNQQAYDAKPNTNFDISLIKPPKLYGSENIKQTTNNTMISEINQEQNIKNVNKYLLCNNQDFVQEINTSVSKLIENVNKNFEKVERQVDAILKVDENTRMVRVPCAGIG